MSGLDRIPLRIPERWDPVWFEWFVRDVLSLADARNAIAGAGIEIEATPDEPARITASADVEELAQASFVLAVAANLPNARVLSVEDAIFDLVDGGPGNAIQIRVKQLSIPYAKMQPIPGVSVLGAPRNEPSTPGAIEAASNDTVLCRIDDEVLFAELTVDMAPDNLWTFNKLQQVEGPAVVGVADASEADLDAIAAEEDGTLLARASDALGFLSVSDVLDLLGSAAEGDILYRGSSGWQLLPRGTDGQVLALKDGVPSWENPDSLLQSTFVTAADETSTLVNSRQLLAGTGITLDASTPGQLSIENDNP